MATNLVRTSKKLIQALNSRGDSLTFSSKQFKGHEGFIHSYYTVSQAVWNEEKQRYYHTELYSSSSMVRIVLFLRDRWYKLNGWELPTDQKKWNELRSDIKEES